MFMHVLFCVSFVSSFEDSPKIQKWRGQKWSLFPSFIYSFYGVVLFGNETPWTFTRMWNDSSFTGDSVWNLSNVWKPAVWVDGLGYVWDMLGSWRFIGDMGILCNAHVRGVPVSNPLKNWESNPAGGIFVSRKALRPVLVSSGCCSDRFEGGFDVVHLRICSLHHQILVPHWLWETHFHHHCHNFDLSLCGGNKPCAHYPQHSI